MDLKTSSTIGYERRHNELFAETDRDRFVERATANLPPQPPNFQAVVDINRGPLLTAGVEVMPLAPRQVEQRRAEGALVVDVRTDLQFAEAHIPASVCLTMLHAGFGTRLAWVVDREQQIVLLGRDDADAHEAARLAAAVGIRNVGGFLAGGMTSWRDEHRDVATLERLAATALPARMEAEPDLQVVDVRERGEWEQGHLAGSTHVPYHDLRRFPAELDRDQSIAAICSSGQRSAVAASLLARHGARNVVHVADGGVGTIAAAGHPLQQGSG
jgi:rhodanese-related sulfurtransferase